MSNKRASKSRKYATVILITILALGSYLIFFQLGGDTPPQITQPENTATVFQAFFITYESGTTRWYYAPERAVALSIIGLDEVNEVVTKVQTHVFMNVNYDGTKTLSSWDFTADVRFMIYSKLGGGGAYTLIKDYGVQSLSESGTVLEENKDVWLLSASITADDIDQLVDFTTSTQYSFKVELRNVNIVINYSDGTRAEMSALGGPANDLEWDFIYV